MKAMLALTFSAALALTAVSAEPALLFDGKTLDHWEGNARLWRVEDGIITGGSLTETVKHNDFLATKKSYANFDLRLKIKVTGKEGFINSGIQIRSVRMPAPNPGMSGYQVDAGDGWWGKLYDESRRNRVIADSRDPAAIKAAIKKDDWNEYRIRAEGPRIQTWINGVPALDYTETDANIAQDGHIGIQVHGGGKALVQVKDITIEELPPTKDAPTWDKVGHPGAKKPKPDAAEATRTQKAGAQTAIGSGPLTPEEQHKTFKLPDGLEMELVAAEIPEMGVGKFVAVYFDQRGAMWTMTALEYPVDGNENAAAADALYKSRAKDKILVYDRDPKSPTGFVSKPRVFADGLAIPLGILPYKDGCYVQHGPDLVLLRDTDGDGKADKREVILTGFGVQDSHLFPHQFTRAPGGWIWMAQGLFNNSKPARPGDDKAVDWPKCSMAKMRMDGSDFEVTSVGPNNIWGLVMTAEGETFIQEANDYGYPVMPFHEYAYYPGGMEAHRKSYQPEFPPQADFRMGGTGLSGLALTDKDGIYPDGWRDVMLVANPITNRVQTIKMHRDGPRWRLEKLGDFVETTDPWFRPVALTLAPDGCVYIVDWYNKIISHNEVPRTHPDRDKTRGRIWRVKPKGRPLMEVPDFTKATGDELIAKLGGASLAQHHLAWQAIVDREMKDLAPNLREIVAGKPAAATANDVRGQARAPSPAVPGAPPGTTNVKTTPQPREPRGSTLDPAGGAPAPPVSQRIGALWALKGLSIEDSSLIELAVKLARDANHNLRREALSILPDLADVHATLERIAPLRASLGDQNSEVRAQVIRSAGTLAARNDTIQSDALSILLSMAKEPLITPTTKATHGNKTIKAGEAYEREYERFLVRMFLERHPEAVAKLLDTDDARKLPLESRLLASLALEPKASAPRVAALLPQLTRPPEREEILRLVQFLDEPGVAEAVRGTLANPATAPAVLAALLELRSKLDPAKLAPILTETATKLLASKDAAQIETGVKLAGAFKLTNLEDALASTLERVARASGLPSDASRVGQASGGGGDDASRRPGVPGETPGTAGGTPALPVTIAIVRALGDIGSAKTDLISDLATTATDPQLRDEALSALAASRAADAPQKTLALFPKLAPAQRRTVLDKLTTTKPGAAAVVAAVTGGSLAKTEIDAPTLDRLLAILGDKDAALNSLVDSLGTLFRPVLALDGSDGAFVETGLTLDGAFTVECWVKLDGKIGNNQGILGAPGQLDINFFDGKFRIWAGPAIHDTAIAKRAIVPGMWTHVAATRDAKGLWKVYLDGELSDASPKPAAHKIENARIGWTGAPGGTRGQIAEFRIWKAERTAEQIRGSFDRAIEATKEAEATALLLSLSSVQSMSSLKLPPSVKITKTTDIPPVLTADAAAKLDADFAKYTALAARPGDIERGKTAAAVCVACHVFGDTGGQIGPNLSGVGAMGVEAILRNILTPNAAMESGYRIFRVEQRDGSVLDAFFVSEDKDAVVIRLPGAADQRIEKKDIVRTSHLRRSLMPEGLLAGMADQQVSDLFAYLLSLK